MIVQSLRRSIGFAVLLICAAAAVSRASTVVYICNFTASNLDKSLQAYDIETNVLTDVTLQLGRDRYRRHGG